MCVWVGWRRERLFKKAEKRLGVATTKTELVQLSDDVVVVVHGMGLVDKGQFIILYSAKI